MSSWCSFRCPCLDELGSKSDLNILYLFFVAKCVYSMFSRTVRLMDDSYLAWRLLWCCDLVHDKMEVVDYWSAKLSLDSMLLILGLAGFNIFYFFSFQNAGFWRLPGQNVFLVFIQVSVPRWVGVQVRSQYPVPFFGCKMCAFHVIRTVRLMDDWFCSGGFFGVVIGFVFNICIC